MATNEVHLFVLAKDVINVLKKTFGREIQSMESLAKKRKKHHEKLIQQLSTKVKIIQRSKQSKVAGTRQFYEANLTNMDDATMQGMELESLINQI